MQKFPCYVSDGRHCRVRSCRGVKGLMHSSAAQGSREDGWGQIVSMCIRSSVYSMHSQAECHV